MRCIIIVLAIVLMTGVAYAGVTEDLIAEQKELIQEIEQRRIRLIEISGVLKYLQAKAKEEAVEEKPEK